MEKGTGPRTIGYRDAGVDIDKADALVEAIKPLARATRRSGVVGSLGGFGGLFDLRAAGYEAPLLVAATDGVGTKLKLALEMNDHSGIGTDLVAMCVNDLVVQGAEPLFFLDYFATGSLDPDRARIVIEGIARGCEAAGAALIGGETAEMPGLYAGSDYDLAGFAVGAVERDRLLPRDDVAAGDVVLGLASSGLHANGFSLVRRILDESGADLQAPPPFASSADTLGKALLTPTRIYVRSCLEAARRDVGIKAFAHITGGGLSDNLPRVLPEQCGAELELPSWPSMFRWLADRGPVAAGEMLRTFNCGIGMAVIVAAESADAAAALLSGHGETVVRIGEITRDPARQVRIGGG